MLDRRHFLQTAALTVTPVLPGLALANPSARRKILVISGWQTVNIGDIAHTPGLLTLMSQLPEIEPVLWPRNIGPEEETILKNNFPKLTIVRSKQEVERAFAECAALVHSSGPSLVAETSIQKWVDETKKPFGVFGITLGDLSTKTKALLDQAEFLYLRDSVSLKRVKEQNVQAKRIDFTPDAAFAVTLRAQAKADAFLKQIGLDGQKFLCCIPRLRYTPYWKIHGKDKTKTDEERYAYSLSKAESDHAKIRAGITAAVQQAGAKVLVCPEDKSHMAVGKEYLVDPLPADIRKHVYWRENYWLTDEALSVYLRSAGMLSMDMHSPIMCIGNGIPAIHCCFAEQTSKGYMWNDIGLNDWLFDLDVEKTGERIAKATVQMLNQAAESAKYTEKARKFVREKHQLASESLKFADIKK